MEAIRSSWGKTHYPIWLEDNSPCHTCNVVREWQELHMQEWDFRLPALASNNPYSPDLNIAEHLWMLMKTDVYKVYKGTPCTPIRQAAFEDKMAEWWENYAGLYEKW